MVVAARRIAKYYRLEGSALDSITGASLTAENATWSAGKLGQCFEGNGSNSRLYVDSGGWSPGSNNFAIAMWLYPHAKNTVAYMRSKTDGSDYIYLYLTNAATPLYEFMINGATARQVRSASAVALNAWTHIVLQRESTTSAQIYIDGAKETVSVISAGNCPTQTVGLERIGCYSTTPAQNILNFDGLIDDVQLYDFGNSTDYFDITQIKRIYRGRHPLGV